MAQVHPISRLGRSEGYEVRDELIEQPVRVVHPTCGPKLGRLEVIDRVRVDRATELRTERAHRKLIVRARWLLLKNRESLHPREDVTLETG